MADDADDLVFKRGRKVKLCKSLCVVILFISDLDDDETSAASGFSLQLAQSAVETEHHSPPPGSGASASHAF